MEKSLNQTFSIRVIGILLVLSLFISPIVLSMTIEQQAGYDLEIKVGNILSKEVTTVIDNSIDASNLAKDLINSKYLSKSTLIKGGSTSSKYATREFARNFIPDFNYAPDFIQINGNEITIIESKLSGTYATEQIKAFNKLAETLGKKGFKVNRKIACKGFCKIPSEWSNWYNRVFKPKPNKLITSTYKEGLTFMKFAEGALTVAMIIDLLKFSYDITKQTYYSNCIDGQVYSFSPDINPPVSYKQCYCKTEKTREECCNKVTYEGYNTLKFIQENKQCQNSYEYKLKVCTEYKVQIECVGGLGAMATLECEKNRENECKSWLSSIGITASTINEVIPKPTQREVCNTNADTNCDGKVDRGELDKYIKLWENNQISREELGKAIVAWQNS